MKKYIYIAIFAVILAGGITIGVQRNRINNLKTDITAYRTTSEALLRNVEHYKTESGQNAAKVQEMQMTLDEFKRYRAADAATISELNVNIKRLEGVNKTQTATILELQSRARDSVIINTTTHVVDTIKCVEYHDAWIDFVGCFDRDWNFNGRIESRDEIICTETVEYKRFLGFLWRTGRVKSREMDVTNRNPHTTITGTEMITIRK